MTLVMIIDSCIFNYINPSALYFDVFKGYFRLGYVISKGQKYVSTP